MANYNGAADTQRESAAGTLSPEQAGTTFHFKKIGPVRNAEMELGDLTVIAGRNNTGKTYIAYTLYGFLKSFSGTIGPFLDATDVLPFASNMVDLAEKLLDSGQVTIPIDSAKYSEERQIVRSIAKKDRPQLMRWLTYFLKECYLECSAHRRHSKEHHLMRNLESGDQTPLAAENMTSNRV